MKEEFKNVIVTLNGKEIGRCNPIAYIEDDQTTLPIIPVIEDSHEFKYYFHGQRKYWFININNVFFTLPESKETNEFMKSIKYGCKIMVTMNQE